MNATIDLRAASLVFGDPIAGGAMSRVDGIFGGYTIANGVVIENAVGGKGNDTLVGNSADNSPRWRCRRRQCCFFRAAPPTR